jgi:tetratricopeptide (TPR) repeat protein
MDRAIADSPDSYVPLFLKANLLLNLGQTDEALKDLAEVKRLNPDHLGTFYTLGSYFLSTSQYEFAEQNFQQVLQLTDDSKLKAQMAFNLAVCYQRQAQYGQALSWARRALKNHPDPDRVRAFVNYLENATRSPN